MRSHGPHVPRYGPGTDGLYFWPGPMSRFLVVSVRRIWAKPTKKVAPSHNANYQSRSFTSWEHCVYINHECAQIHATLYISQILIIIYCRCLWRIAVYSSPMKLVFDIFSQKKIIVIFRYMLYTYVKGFRIRIQLLHLYCTSFLRRQGCRVSLNIPISATRRTRNTEKELVMSREKLES